jgi:hypothetical protein
MTEDRNKSLKEKKLEGILDMGESLKNLDVDEVAQTNKNDEEKKLKMEERKKFLAEHKEQFDIVRKKPDLEFSREIYKELIMTDMEILRIVRKEIEMDPSPRAVETAASLTSSINSTVDSLRDIDEVKVDQGFEREKIDMKRNASSAGNITTGVMMAGAFTDIMDKIGEMKKLKEKTVEAVVVETTTEKDGVKKDKI